MTPPRQARADTREDRDGQAPAPVEEQQRRPARRRGPARGPPTRVRRAPRVADQRRHGRGDQLGEERRTGFADDQRRRAHRRTARGRRGGPAMPGSSGVGSALGPGVADVPGQEDEAACDADDAATTMSTTRQRQVLRRVRTCDVRASRMVDVDVLIVNSSLRWHDPDQVRRSKRGSLPLSPAHRTPVLTRSIIPPCGRGNLGE